MTPVTKEAVRLLFEGAVLLSKIESNGVRVNVDYLDKVTRAVSLQIRDLEEVLRADEVYSVWKKRFGQETKLSSREQLAEVVFGKSCLGYKVHSLTAKGRVAANKDALDDVELPFVENFLKFENLKKTLNTYLIGIRQEMVQDGKFWFVHPSYNLATISTYRSSCRSPNFQNVPKRNPEMAGLIRPCFMPHPGHHFVEVDFSQLEVRIAACYHNDPTMVRYINDPDTDMHGDTAAEMFFLNKEELKAAKKTARDSAKNQFVFPQFYGSNYVNCCKAVWKRMKQQKWEINGRSIFQHLASHGIKEKGDCVQGQDPRPGTFEAHLKKIERGMWHKRFPVYTQWRKDFYEQYCRTGGFRMLTGFAVNVLLKRLDVTNYPIQGSAFHCLIWVLLEVQKWIEKYKMKTRIVGEIHDAGQFSVPPKELQDFLTLVYDLMTVRLPKAWSWISVPLDAEADVSPVDGHWMECSQWVPDRNGEWNLKS